MNKKLLYILFFLIISTFGMTQTTTPNIGLTQPALGSLSGWGASWNHNASIIDNLFIGRVFVDATNTQGWAGTDIAGWIKSAQASSLCSSGCIIDARGAGTVSFSSEIDVGNSAGTKPITLLLPCQGQWTDNDTTNTHYGLRVYNESQVVGCGTGEGQAFAIQASATANLDSLCGNDPTTGHYVIIEGFICRALAGATIANSVLNINGVEDESYVGHMGAHSASTTAHKALWVHKSCCSTNIDNVSSETFATVGAVPCTFGESSGNNTAVHFSNLSCVHPGSGENAVAIVESSSGGNLYTSIYTEEATGADTTTAVVGISGSSGQVEKFDTLTLGVDITNSTRYIVDIASGSTAMFDKIVLGSVSINGINDHNSGRGTISPGTGATIPHYESLASGNPNVGYYSNIFAYGNVSGINVLAGTGGGQGLGFQGLTPSSTGITTGGTDLLFNGGLGTIAAVNGVNVQIFSSSPLQFLSSGFAQDTSVSRCGAGCVGIGTGAAGSTNGTVDAAIINSNGGGNIIYRCSVAGAARVGTLTSVAADCGTAVDTGLRTP